MHPNDDKLFEFCEQRVCIKSARLREQRGEVNVMLGWWKNYAHQIKTREALIKSNNHNISKLT
jgi:hypothetical protein